MPLPGPLSTALQQVVHGLLTHTAPASQQRRVYSEIFKDLPDKKSYPDYYVFIKEPRALNGILDSLKRGRYSSPQAVAWDLFLVWANARTYNEPESQVYADADKLERHMRKLWTDKTPPLPDWNSLPRPGSIPSPAKASTLQQTAAVDEGDEDEEDAPKVKRLKVTLSSATAPTAPQKASTSIKPIKLNVSKPAPPAQPSLKLRLGGSAQAAPPVDAAEPEAGPSAPSSMPKSKKKAGKKAAADAVPQQPVEELSAREGRLKEREEQQSAEPPARAHKKKRKSSPLLVKDEDEDVQLVEADDSVVIDDDQSGYMPDMDKSKMVEIVKKLRSVADGEGRVLAAPIMSVPDAASRPDYHERVKEPIALDVIEKKAAAGEYADVVAFETDMKRLFRIARMFIKPESPGHVYGDLNYLQRYYQEHTKTGPQTPPKPIVVGDAPYPVAFANDSVVAPVKTGPQPASLVKVRLNSVHYKGDDYKIGDWVLLANPENPGKPVIAQIFETYTRKDTKQRWIAACWYFRPEETVHPVTKTFFENEVFKTQTFREHCVEDIISRCLVLFNTSGTIKGTPSPADWDPETPLYYVGERYKEDGKTFKKIKVWSTAVPPAIKHAADVEVVPFANGRIVKLATKKSPFAPPVAPVTPPASYPPINENAPSAANKPVASSGPPKVAPPVSAAVALPGPATAPAATPTPAPAPVVTAARPPIQPPPPQQAAAPRTIPPTQFGSNVVRPTQPHMRPSMPLQPSLPQQQQHLQPQQHQQQQPQQLGVSPLEATVSNLVFARLPASVEQKLSAGRKETVWFATPPVWPLEDSDDDEPVLQHSFKHRVWKARQAKARADALINKETDKMQTD